MVAISSFIIMMFIFLTKITKYKIISVGL